MRVLGTTVVGSAGRSRYVLMGRVKGFVEDFERLAMELLGRAGLPRGTPVFLTAADLRRSYVSASCEVDGARAEVHATFGLSGMACLDGGTGAGGTLNVLISWNVGASRRGLLDALRVASEVKGALSVLSGLSCRSSAAVGTVSDATLVALPPGREVYFGLATPQGRAGACALSRAFSRYVMGMEAGRRLAMALGLEGGSCEGVAPEEEALVRAIRLAALAASSGLSPAPPLRGSLGRLLRDVEGRCSPA